MADTIANLPVDESPEVPEDAQIINKYLVTETQKDGIKKIYASNRDILFATAAFVVLSLPIADTLLIKVYPASESSMMYRIGIKALIFLLTVFIINNIQYMRKK